MWIIFLKIYKMALYWFCGWKKGGWWSYTRRGLICGILRYLQIWYKWVGLIPSQSQPLVSPREIQLLCTTHPPLSRTNNGVSCGFTFSGFLWAPQGREFLCQKDYVSGMEEDKQRKNGNTNKNSRFVMKLLMFFCNQFKVDFKQNPFLGFSGLL